MTALCARSHIALAAYLDCSSLLPPSPRSPPPTPCIYQLTYPLDAYVELDIWNVRRTTWNKHSPVAQRSPIVCLRYSCTRRIGIELVSHDESPGVGLMYPPRMPPVAYCSSTERHVVDSHFTALLPWMLRSASCASGTRGASPSDLLATEVDA